MSILYCRGTNRVDYYLKQIHQAIDIKNPKTSDSFLSAFLLSDGSI